MKTNLKRRAFVNTCFKAGVACCALSYGPALLAQDTAKKQDGKPDPKKLEYCGYKCPDGCPLKKGTLENDPELKKKAWTDFKYKEKYNMDFDPEKVFCYGCRTDKPLGMPVRSCTVRACVIAKGYDCCIQCDTLGECDKELWKNYPDFKKAVIEMQKKYREA